MLTKKILQPGPNDWCYLEMANCYQFAIGLREDLWDRKLMPGDLSGHEKPDGYRYSDDELIQLVKEDLYSIGYEVQEYRDNSIIGQGEWMICILNCSQKEREYDFHFLVKFSNEGCWFQKFAEEQFAESVSSPESGNYHYNYRVVGYYKIKKIEE